MDDKIKVFNSTEELLNSMSEFFFTKANQRITDNKSYTVALSGGSTPNVLYQYLATHHASAPEWAHTHVFWGDERPVPIDHPDSNAGMTKKALLDHVPIPDDHINPIFGNLRPDIAALQYEELLQEFFQGHSPKFDFIMLGMGADGHTASLFPHVPFPQKVMTWVKEVWVENLDTYRITLTPQLINQAECIAFLAYGEKKAEALYEVLEGESNTEKYPAQLISADDGELHWFVDHKAAAWLRKGRS